MSTSTRAVTSPVGRSLGSRRLKGALPSVTSLAPDHFTEPESPQGDASLNPLRAPRTCEKPVLRARRQKEGTATVQRVFLSVSPTRSAIASLIYSYLAVLKLTISFPYGSKMNIFLPDSGTIDLERRWWFEFSDSFRFPILPITCCCRLPDFRCGV